MSEIYEKILPKEVYITSITGNFLEVVENHDGIAIYRKIDIEHTKEKAKEIEERVKRAKAQPKTEI